MRFYSLLLLTLVCNMLHTAVYYVDYKDGDDQALGTSPEAAWKHAPGDTAATGIAQKCKLKPGDMLRLKGGVRYYGSISINYGGSDTAPVIIDGNFDGTYGSGPAVIDGSLPVSEWEKVEDAKTALNNPNWEKLYYADIKSNSNWNLVNLHNLDRSFPVAQEPNMPDSHYQEMGSHYFKNKHAITERRDIKIEAIGMKVTGNRPLVAMFDGSRTSAVINDMQNGAFKITLPETKTINSIGITPQPNYSNPRQIRITIDNGEEIAVINPTESGKKLQEQHFELAKPATFKEITFHFEGAHPKNGKESVWGAVQKIAAYTADKNNVLVTQRRFYLRNESVLNQSNAAHWDGAAVAVHGLPEMVYFHNIKSFNPETNEIEIPGYNIGKAGRGHGFSLFNSLHILDKPGEFVVKKLDAETMRIFFWPTDDTKNLRISKHHVGLNVQASNVTIQGIHTRGQGGKKSGTGLNITPKNGRNIIVRGCDIALCRGRAPAVHIAYANNTLVEDTFIHHNALHTKGLVARRLTGIVVRNCTFIRNTSTAFDYYTVKNGSVLDCLIKDNQGMHANGLTFYVGCENILVEGNEVYDGNSALTCQDGKNLIVRNNILESKHSNGFSIWDGKVLNNIVICNNIIRGHTDKNGQAQSAIFGGHPATKNVAIYNNIIIGGLAGNIAHKAHFDYNIFCQLGSMTKDDIVSNNTQVEHINDLFVDAAKRDYRLKSGSPAIASGKMYPGLTPFDKLGQPWKNQTPSIGPYQADSNAGFRTGADATNLIPDDYAFSAPSLKSADYSKPNFEHTSSEPIITLTGASFSGQGNGKVRVKDVAKNIFGWDNKDHWLEWTLDIPEAGNYEICLELSTATMSKRNFQINGKAIPDLQEYNMSYTGGWSNWQKQFLPTAVSLKSGKNVLHINNAGGSLNVLKIHAYRIND